MKNKRKRIIRTNSRFLTTARLKKKYVTVVKVDMELLTIELFTNLEGKQLRQHLH